MADVSSLQSEYEYPIVHHFSYFTSFPSTGTHTNWLPFVAVSVTSSITIPLSTVVAPSVVKSSCCLFSTLVSSCELSSLY